MDNHDFLRILVRENLERQILYEGLIYSHSPESLIKKIKKLGFRDVVYDVSQNSIIINFVLNKDNKKRYEKLNNIIYNVYGWFHGMSVVNGLPTKDKLDFIKHESGAVSLKYEAKFDIEVSDIPEKMYHLTTCGRLKKILKIGLTPKSCSQYFNFEDRIYFSTKIDPLLDFVKQKKITLNSDENCFVILEIKIKGITDRIRFFKDPNFKDVIYTLENIIPFAVNPVLKLRVDERGDIISKENV